MSRNVPVCSIAAVLGWVCLTALTTVGEADAAPAPQPRAEAADLVWLGPDGRPLPLAGRAAAVEFLRHATVLDTEEIPGSQNEPLEVLLERDGVRAHAIFRSVNRIWEREWIRGTFRTHLIDRAASERAAYVVACLLGLDNVPPTVLREVEGRRGSLQLWIEGGESLAALTDRRGPLPPRFTEQMTVIWAFDKLIYNVDRHPGNIIIGPDGTLWMVDHTQAFQYDHQMPGREAPVRLPGQMAQRLRQIPDALWKEALSDALNSTQIDALLARRDRLISGR